MRRLAYVVIGSGLFAVFGNFVAPAKAGEPGSHAVWYSSSCCYARIVRHERDVRYVPAGPEATPFAYGRYPPVDGWRPEPHCIVQQSAFNYANYPLGPRC